MNKKIGINQRIPLDTLYVSLECLLNDNYSDEYILEQLRLHFNGENRLVKALAFAKKIVPNNPMIKFLIDNKEEVKIALKQKSDRNIILISLLNSAYVFSFDMLSIFGKLFKVQSIINREALTREITKIYGSNRAIPNALDSVVPMYLEAEFFNRPKYGLYEFEKPLRPNFEITSQIYIESFKIHNLKIQFQDYLLMDPYFEFVE